MTTRFFRVIFKRTIGIQLIVLFLAILFTFLTFSFLIQGNLSKQLGKQLLGSLQTYQNLIIQEKLSPTDLCSSIKKDSRFRITVINHSGKVICDSTGNASTMDNHSNRPEVIEARRIGQGKATRFSKTLKTQMIYQGLNIEQKSIILRMAMPLTFIDVFLDKAKGATFFILVPIFMILSIVSILFGLKSDEIRRNRTEKLKVDLVANISHEVRTPLTALKGYVQVLRSFSQNLKNEQLDYLNKIEHNTERLTILFRDVLDLSNLENNQRLTFELLPVQEITEKIINSINQVYKDKNLNISYDIQLDSFEGNGKTIEQLLNNLVDNACKYTPREGNIHIHWDKHEGHAQLTVKDSGIGIPDKDRDRIFERFFRIDGSRSREMGGTGLGLAIVKHVTQRHNGRVWFESVPDTGTTFFAKFPLKQS